MPLRLVLAIVGVGILLAITASLYNPPKTRQSVTLTLTRDGKPAAGIPVALLNPYLSTDYGVQSPCRGSSKGVLLADTFELTDSQGRYEWARLLNTSSRNTRAKSNASFLVFGMSVCGEIEGRHTVLWSDSRNDPFVTR